MNDRGDGGRSPSAKPRPPLSVLITARDEEATLPAALASVAAWADEVVAVIDPRTRDRTREIASAGGARVFERPFTSSAEQLGWGLEQCAHDWVLILDADERVPARARAAIDRTLAAPHHEAYALHRRNFAFGRPLRFGDWGSDRVTRLVRRNVRLAGGMHWRVLTPAPGTLGGYLEHDTLRDLDGYLAKAVDYASRGGAQAAESGRKVGIAALIVRPMWRFVRAYVLRLGFLDGVPGLIVAGLGASGTFVKWAIAWQRATNPAKRT